MEIQDNDLEELYAETFRSIEVGSMITGTVIGKSQEVVIVDIGYKSEGYIKREEFSEQEYNELKEGSKIEVIISRIKDSEGTITLSKRKASMMRAQNLLSDAHNTGESIVGTIIEKTKGGFIVDISGMRAFLPGSQYDIKPVKSSDDIIGTTSEFKIIKMNKKLNNVIVSRRALLEETLKTQKVETLTAIKEGSIVKGLVKNVTDYGVFIDLGGLDGLLHISDISWGRINHPSEVFSIGDPVEVVVLKYDEDSEKITLGYKQKKSDPWLNIEIRYPEGSTVTGKIVGIKDYGAFIELEEGIEGLVYISELDWNQRPKHPSKYVELGQVVQAVVLKVDKEERRISLGIKQLKPKPWDLVARNYKIGDTVTGKIRSLTDFGAFIALPEGVDALIHISDISWTKHIKHPSEVFKAKQRIDAVVLSLEPEKERMSLGIKQLNPDPWIKEIPNKFRLGDEVECVILRNSEHGIFVEIDEGLEGLIYDSEIIKADENVFKEGQRLKARIIRLDTEQRKIGLSMLNAVKERGE
ncbi:MAG: 30S ribosomal protein S1 [Nitrospirae bacterium]|nr:30S ribosomal protein S1 [Nitrospirota bacterium]